MSKLGVSVRSQPRANRMGRRKVFAICLRERRGKVDGVLMIVDEQQEAEEIAIELRRKGLAVEVRVYVGSDEELE